MPERYVFCGGLRAGRNRPDALHIDVNAPAGSPARVNLHIGDLSGPLADNIPDVLTDMLEVAAYVYCADQFTQAWHKPDDGHGRGMAPQVPIQNSRSPA